MARVTLDWLHIVALLGAIQGVFLAGVLATKRRNRTANRLLAVAMLAFSIYLATAVYHAAGLEQVFPHFFGAAFPLPMLYGPLIYLYAVAASDRTCTGDRRLRPASIRCCSIEGTRPTTARPRAVSASSRRRASSLARTRRTRPRSTSRETTTETEL